MILALDPAAELAETQGYGYKGETNGAKVVTIYSLGEGSKEKENIQISYVIIHLVMVNNTRQN